MQQQSPMFPVTPSFPANITTDQIQKYLDENKKLILAILDYQNLGKLAECAQFQALLQKNLMYLAAIADAQPQTSTVQPQMSPYPPMQQGGYYMQHPQAPPAAQQPGLYPQKMHQQAGQGQMNMGPAGANNSGQPTHSDATGGGVGGGPPVPSGGNDGREANKQDLGLARRGNPAAGHEEEAK